MGITLDGIIRLTVGSGKSTSETSHRLLRRRNTRTRTIVSSILKK